MLEDDGRVVTAEGTRAEGGSQRPPEAPPRLGKHPDLESPALSEVGSGQVEQVWS